ncbi:DUF6030 family protein [Rhizobium gallicum]|uniref:DUF6030 family protein n=1 Tax=Rhizobium gallicum TaxID=56730 RepID=UPI00193A0BAF|nr:DUF6030 family protein [Rhizobium gallicum]
MATQPSGLHMKTPPPRRKRRAALWLMLTLSISLVAGTVLLSNDMRHLRSLAALSAYHLNPQVQQPEPPPLDPVEVAKPAPQLPVKIPPRLIEIPKSEFAGNFLRTWRKSGPDMCETLRKAGIEMTKWRASAMGSSAYECSFQEVYKDDGERPLSSVFLIIRGDRNGTISNIRAKIVGPATDSAGRLDPSFMRVFEAVLAQSHWLDFHDALSAIEELKDVREEAFGASVVFSREFSSQNSFNFIMTIKAAPGPQMRTRAYFSTGRWMPAPDNEVSEALPPIFR